MTPAEAILLGMLAGCVPALVAVAALLAAERLVDHEPMRRRNDTTTEPTEEN
jgi:hypothetical protein